MLRILGCDPPSDSVAHTGRGRAPTQLRPQNGLPWSGSGPTEEATPSTSSGRPHAIRQPRPVQVSYPQREPSAAHERDQVSRSVCEAKDLPVVTHTASPATRRRVHDHTAVHAASVTPATSSRMLVAQPRLRGRRHREGPPLTRLRRLACGPLQAAEARCSAEGLSTSPKMSSGRGPGPCRARGGAWPTSSALGNEPLRAFWKSEPARRASTRPQGRPGRRGPHRRGCAVRASHFLGSGRTI